MDDASIAMSGLKCIGTGNNVGSWILETGTFANIGNLGGWTLLALTWDGEGTMWCVGTAYNVGKWDGQGWVDQGNLGGWTIQQLAFDTNNTMWCVGTAGNVGKWNGSGWDNQGNMGKWTLRQLAFAPNGDMWCVGSAKNVGKWNGDGWDSPPHYSDWEILQITFDPNGNMWCVGNGNNVGTWNYETGAWKDMGNLGSWTLIWMEWPNVRPSQVNYTTLGTQCAAFAGNLANRTLYGEFIANPVDTMIANGVTLSFLSEADLTNLSDMLTAEIPPTIAALEGTEELGGAWACWGCRIGCWVTFTVFQVALTIATAGTAPAAESGFIVALANVVRLAPATVQTIITGLGRQLTINGIINKICAAANLCQSLREASGKHPATHHQGHTHT